MSGCRRLCACLLNVSEARNDTKIHNIAAAALKVNQREKQARAAVLNIFQDKDYNRSVLTIVASLQDIGASVQSACEAAYGCIDLREHHGGHPRLGAVDLIPIHPISHSVTLHDCAKVAKACATGLSKAIPGTSFFLAGHAHPLYHGLVARRKAVGWFRGKHGSCMENLPYDVGQPPAGRYGLTGVASIPYVTNCNVTLDSQDLQIGQDIAKAIRAVTPGGFPGVQSMAFAHEGKVEIACNIEGIYIESRGSNNANHKHITELENTNRNPESYVFRNDNVDRTHLVNTFGDCFHVASQSIEDAVREMALERGVTTVEEAKIVGFEPKECERLANMAMDSGQAEFWKTRSKRTM